MACLSASLLPGDEKQLELDAMVFTNKANITSRLLNAYHLKNK